MAQDPESEPTPFGLRSPYAPAREVRVDLPPGLIGDPNVLGASQQCTAAELAGLACPNGSQIGRARVFAEGIKITVLLPIYMMRPPGGEKVARMGIAVPGSGPIYIEIEVRSEDDYGLTATVFAPFAFPLIRTETTLWGVPADPAHDTERCTPEESWNNFARFQCPGPPARAPLPSSPTRPAAAFRWRCE